MTIIDKPLCRHQSVKVTQTQEVELDRAQFLDLVHVELGGDGIVLHSGGDRPQQRLVAHHDAGRMDTCLSDDPRHFVDLLKQFGVLLSPGGQCPTLALHHFTPGGVLITSIRLNGLDTFDDLRHGDLIAHRDAHGPAKILEDRLWLTSGQSSDCADVILAVTDCEIIFESRSQALGEVAVNVGIAFSTGAEKPAEQQAVANGVDGSNPQEVGDEGATG